ncbi:protein of unknown function DUF214 [Gloeothece citriformis PCC 7424]|uniref:FtsX-like permease family protein n=1 Tax=Gloeothece citriformis (strain PCC 7424) TaxID=65393 RepID=B7KA90_GLOC7|nr:ABC transporter permease [Gloeothece citriformis]ACK72864.1 protein of unknown function DUF214 [Gloeothece citriformis PCC 7424]
MEILENLKMAFSSLMGNKLRSSLTMLGIAIGNGSVVALIGVGQGAQQLAAQQFQALGPNILYVTVSRSMRRSITNARPLVLEDAQAIKNNVPSVTLVAPEIYSDQLITYQENNYSTSSLGTTPEYLNVRNYQLDKGRFINEVDVKRHNRVVVLGSEVAEKLFKNENPIGQLVRIRNTSFQVIGVLASKGFLFGSNQDDKAIVPLTTMAYQLIGYRSPYGMSIHVISVLAKDENSLKTAEFQIENLIQLRHQVKLDGYVEVNNQQSIMETATETNEGLTRMLAAIASISLVVGGIGVMNIMLVSVTERTKEIGLRKAVGAQEQDIMTQFLIEAVILATTGGMIGIFVSIGGIIIAETFFSMVLTISPEAIIIAMGVSGAIGLFFGVVPAKRAAKLDPIVALRSS